MFSAVGPERLVSLMRMSSAPMTSELRSTNVISSSSSRWACSNSRRSDVAGIGRPPSPAIAVSTGTWVPRSPMRTLDARAPPSPTERFFSITRTRLARSSAVCTALSGKGRNEAMATEPTFWPSSRISSTTSLMVPLMDPIATMIVSASSVR